jgi:hypothetical protein
VRALAVLATYENKVLVTPILTLIPEIVESGTPLSTTLPFSLKGRREIGQGAEVLPLPVGERAGVRADPSSVVTALAVLIALS